MFIQNRCFKISTRSHTHTHIGRQARMRNVSLLMHLCPILCIFMIATSTGLCVKCFFGSIIFFPNLYILFSYVWNDCSISKFILLSLSLFLFCSFLIKSNHYLATLKIGLYKQLCPLCIHKNRNWRQKRVHTKKIV